MPQEVSGGCPVCCRRQCGKDPGQVPWIQTQNANLFFGTLIVLNAALLGVDIEVALQSGRSSTQSAQDLSWWRTAILIVQCCFTLVFLFELLLRVLADGLSSFSWRRPAYILDALVILCSAVEYSVVLAIGLQRYSEMRAASILRVVSLFRLVRLLIVWPQLKQICSNFLLSLRATFWVFCLLLVMMYMCALVCTTLLGDILREDFGSISVSIYTHFMILTMEGYPDVVAAAAEESGWFWYVYFIGYILFTNVMLMNLVTGIICESVIRRGEQGDKAHQQWLREFEKFQEVVFGCMTEAGLSLTDEMDFEQFKKVMRLEGIRLACQSMDICLELEDEHLFNIIDEDRSGKLSMEEFFVSFSRLRGSKEKIHSLLVQADVVQTHHATVAELEKSVKMTLDFSETVSARLETEFSQRLQPLKARLDKEMTAEVSDSLQREEVEGRMKLQGLLKTMEASNIAASGALSGLQGEILASRERITVLKERLILQSGHSLEVSNAKMVQVASDAAAPVPVPEESSEVPSALQASPNVSHVSIVPAPQGQSPGPNGPGSSGGFKELQPARSASSKSGGRMDSLRRLRQKHDAALAMPRLSKTPAKSSRHLDAYHGHAKEAQGVAKAATYESSSGSEAEVEATETKL